MHDGHGRLDALVGQLGMLILINIAFGFAVPGIDNAAHIGGLLAGFVIGVLVPPHGVQTLATLWQTPDKAGTAHVARVPNGIIFVALAPIAIAVVVGLFIGTELRA